MVRGSGAGTQGRTGDGGVRRPAEVAQGRTGEGGGCNSAAQGPAQGRRGEPAWRPAEAEVVAARGPIPPPPTPCGRRVERRQLRASVRDGEREARAAGSMFRDQVCLWALH